MHDLNLKVTIQLFIDNSWIDIGEVTLQSEKEISYGYKGKCYFNYKEEFISLYYGENGSKAVSLNNPIEFGISDFQKGWPPFLFDLLPSGYARRYWLNRLSLTNQPASDWELLCKGAGNPIGNMRIKEAVKDLVPPIHKGFKFKQILDKKLDFLNFAYEQGVSIAGSSGAQGDAPKFLIVENKKGNWQLDGAISDNDIKKSWLVKLPRGRQEIDTIILKTEAIFLTIAKELDFFVIEPPFYQRGMLFVPRFDREIIGKKLYRHGLESIYSVAKISEYGAFLALEDVCDLIIRFSSRAKTDLKEFIFRDLLNYIFLNTDNHGRNTAFLKNSITKEVYLSPLYDLAPMALDSEGIIRVMRWKNFEDGVPDWFEICRYYDGVLRQNYLTKEINEFYKKILLIPKLLKKYKADDIIYEGVLNRIKSLDLKKGE